MKLCTPLKVRKGMVYPENETLVSVKRGDVMYIYIYIYTNIYIYIYLYIYIYIFIMRMFAFIVILGEIM